MAVVPRIAAHRGGAALWPENSLAAFAGALALGVDLLEFDVHQSADGEVVVIHDPTLDRTTEGAGAVCAQPAATLRRLHLRDRDGALTDERVRWEMAPGPDGHSLMRRITEPELAF